VAKAGDIVIVDFPGAQGIKRRPAVVIPSDINHQSRPDVVVGLITSQIASATDPTDCVLQDWKAAGLHSPSAFRSCFVTLPQRDIIAQVGPLSSRDWQAVVTAFQAALAK
jgi:mRNA interferase MazF